MRNEGPHLLEWFAHHKSLGFTDFFLAQNDSDDGTREMLEILRDLGEIEYLENSEIWANPNMRLKHQFQTNMKAAKSSAYRQADWAMMIDGDEFIALGDGLETIEDLIASFDDDVDAIVLYWLLFGSSHHVDVMDELVTQSFTFCEDEERLNFGERLYKVLFRPSKFGRASVHFPRNPKPSNLKITDGAKRSLQLIDQGQNLTAPCGPQPLGYVFHYRIMDIKRFISKHLREQNGKRPNKLGLKYWAESDHNARRNLRLASREQTIRGLIDDLDRRANGALKNLTQLSCEYHREQFDQALTNDADASKLFQELSARHPTQSEN